MSRPCCSAKARTSIIAECWQLITREPQALAQPLDHGEVGPLPGVVFGLGVPLHRQRMDCVARTEKPLGIAVEDRKTAPHLGLPMH
jgi:hypothetical protein